ncbi:MAG: hypothetical protein AMK71_08840 [Nitrospira bacterium SG8_35_4]|nr:MAG: hypothetical protein AMK71_08840 [Nitrospira bacterium SG8_35_4]
MQPQSMTGYGRGAVGNFKVEIRSSNHKNLDIQINVPYYLFSHEPEIRKQIKNRLNRGRIDVYVPRSEDGIVRMKVNKPLAREYYNALVSLKEELSIKDEIGIDVLASQRDIFLMDEPEIDTADLYKAVDAAMEELEKTRIEEGRNLILDIRDRIGLLKKYLASVESSRTDFMQGARQRLQERLEELLGNAPIDESRLIQETAILIDRSDITEEIVRAKSHIESFENTLISNDTVGKKLDFMVQELRREINTIGSKAQEIEIINSVVEMKHELEKIKEQIQNLQ